MTLAPLTHTYETAGSRGEGPWTNVDYIHALATCRVARSSLRRNWPPAFHTCRAPPSTRSGTRSREPATSGRWRLGSPTTAVRRLVGVGSARRECRNVISGAAVQLQRTHSDPPAWMAASRSNVVHAPGPIGRPSAANLGRREPQGIVRHASSSTHYARETPDARLEHQEPLRLRDDSRSKSERPARYCAEETA